MGDFIKQYVARFLAGLVFAAIGGWLVSIGISEGQLYQIILALISLIAGGGLIAHAGGKALYRQPPQ